LPVVLLTCVYLIRETLLSVYLMLCSPWDDRSLRNKGWFVVTWKTITFWNIDEVRNKLWHRPLYITRCKQATRSTWQHQYQFYFLSNERCELHKTLFNLESRVRNIPLSLKGRTVFFLLAGNDFFTRSKIILSFIYMKNRSFSFIFYQKLYSWIPQA
jgi:hypothetical protein